jgi:hypothetical protein
VDLQEQLEIGKQAEDFLRYLSEHPYLEGLLERMKLEYARQILDLNHDQTIAFSNLKSEMVGVDQVMNSIRGDVYLGSQALKKLNGESDEPKGLL